MWLILISLPAFVDSMCVCLILPHLQIQFNLHSDDFQALLFLLWIKPQHVGKEGEWWLEENQCERRSNCFKPNVRGKGRMRSVLQASLKE